MNAGTDPTPSSQNSTSDGVQIEVTFRQAFVVWCRVAALSFGGPAGQIAVMHRILVDEKKWVSEERFLHALNYCMLLPGPEAQQLATYIGWLLHRTIGGLVAGLLFVLPGFVSILGLSVLYAQYNDVSFVEGIFYGLKPAVVAIVIEAVVRIGRRALKSWLLVSLAALSFVGIFFFEVPFPVIVLSAGLIGFAGSRIAPHLFLPPTNSATIAETDAVTHRLRTIGPAGWRRTFVVLIVWLTVWLAPVLALHQLAGRESIYTREAVFFSQAAVVTFGGAYSVLAWVSQECVESFGWLKPHEMLDGLGMAETTPGPLVQVVQFVGFMGAYRNAGELNPLLAGVLGSVITTWVTFAPCFLWIFLGAPFIERLRGQMGLNAALKAITAAVVGVILNLSIWFAVHTLFATVEPTHVGPLRLLVPNWTSIDLFAAAITITSLIAMLRFKAGMLWTLLGSVIAGLIANFAW